MSHHSRSVHTVPGIKQVSSKSRQCAKGFICLTSRNFRHKPKRYRATFYRQRNGGPGIEATVRGQ